MIDRFRFCFVAVGLAMAVLSDPPQVQANAGSQDWPAAAGPTGDCKSPMTGIRKNWTGGLNRIWESAELLQGDPAKNFSDSGPVVADGVLIALGRGDDKDLIFAFDADSGKKLWMQEYPAKQEKKWVNAEPGDGPRATPIIEDGLVYTLGEMGHLACWNLKTGEQKWLVNVLEIAGASLPPWGVSSAPVLYGNNILVNVTAGDSHSTAPLVIALDKASGKLAWKSADNAGSYAPLVLDHVSGKDQVLAWVVGGVQSVNAADGKNLWFIPWQTGFHATPPAVDGTVVFLSAGYQQGCAAFDVKDDKPLQFWKNKAVSSCNSMAIISDGLVYSGTGNGWSEGAIKCLDLKTGEEKWAAKDVPNGTVTLIDGCLLCFTYRGNLALVEAKGDGYHNLGQMDVFRIKTNPGVYAPAAVARGKVYVRYMKQLIALDLIGVPVGKAVVADAQAVASEPVEPKPASTKPAAVKPVSADAPPKPQAAPAPAIAVKPIVADAPADHPLDLVQEIKGAEEGIPKMAGVFDIKFIKDFLYVSNGSDGNINYYKRDAKTGMLTYGGNIAVGKRVQAAFPRTENWGTTDDKNTSRLAVAGERLYAFPGNGTALTWYDIDPQSGEPKEKGILECAPAQTVAVSPDQKDIYVWSEGGPHKAYRPRFIWFHLADDGAPVRAGEILGTEEQDYRHYATLICSPDGKFLYSLSDLYRKLVCLTRKPTGEIEIQKSVDLDAVSRLPPAPGHRQWTGLNMTPDGKWLFVSSCPKAYTLTHRIYVFKRDVDSGELTYQNAVEDGSKCRQIVFMPDGKSGYAGSIGGLESFSFDSTTGKMTPTGKLLEADGTPPLRLAFDPEHKFLYAGTYCFFYPVPPAGISNTGDRLFVVKVK